VELRLTSTCEVNGDAEREQEEDVEELRIED